MYSLKVFRVMHTHVKMFDGCITGVIAVYPRLSSGDSIINIDLSLTLKMYMEFVFQTCRLKDTLHTPLQTSAHSQQRPLSQ